VDARKTRFGEADLEQVFAGAGRIIAARGKTAREFSAADLTGDGEARAALAKAVLGPSGNLRAPALRMGKTWLVGFGEPAWLAFFG